MSNNEVVTRTAPPNSLSEVPTPARAGWEHPVVRVVSVTDHEVPDPSKVLASAQEAGWEGGGTDQDVPAALQWLATRAQLGSEAPVISAVAHVRDLDPAAGDTLADESRELKSWLATMGTPTR